jgi:hypothetical protein
MFFCPFSDYKEYNTDTTVRFVVTMSAEKLRAAEAEGLHKFFKLQTTVSLSSMVNIITIIAGTGFQAFIDIFLQKRTRILYFILSCTFKFTVEFTGNFVVKKYIVQH